MTKVFRYLPLVILAVFMTVQHSYAAGDKHEEESGTFNLVEFAMHHIGDSYAWEFYKKKDGTKVKISLPRILWNKADNRLDIYGSTRKALNAGYIEEHDVNHDAAHGKLIIPGSAKKYKSLHEELGETDDTQRQQAIKKDLAELKPLDLSITKSVLYMFFAGLLLLWIFISMAIAYKKNPHRAPKGLQSFFEPIVVFIRDDIAKTYIPHAYERFLPLLLNFFFFIWFLNMLGLTPFAANVTGNIAVTAGLAAVTLVFTNINGKKHYWQHIFWFPGVPVLVKPIMFVVEFVSLFTKPFALMIRLFANITAGHLVVFSFISLIFLFGKLGEAAAAGWATSVVSVAFTTFIYLIEILIALLQAYIFTTMSALFIGQAVEDH